MFQKVLIANRGAIACRIIRTLKRLGIKSVAVYSDADRDARHVFLADEAVRLGPAPAAQSYLNVEAVLAAARTTGAQAIHPGYGFLSENASFAEACAAAGIVFIGPRPEQMLAFGLKHRARELAHSNAVPMLPGSGLLDDVTAALREAQRIGYPVMLKSTAGGGGIGMQRCHTADELDAAFASVSRLAKNNFKDGGLFLEKFVSNARHIEVQVFGDGKGFVAHLGERDCSLQRRNQKVVEETPAPGLSDGQRGALHATALRLMRSVAYQSAGTVEFVFDRDSGEFYFLEVNTRLQVEHGVTEEVCGVDLVEWMVRQACDELPVLYDYQYAPQGHAVQVRLYAEDPARQFQPASGELTAFAFPDGIRVEAGFEPGASVPPNYDPMLAKLIAHAPDRATAINRLRQALADSAIGGIVTNRDYLIDILAEPAFQAGAHITRTLADFAFQARAVEVLSPGVMSTVQDYPGRVGLWNVGVPPSGPMDSLAFRLGNRLLGNATEAAGLEITLQGPTLRFHSACTVVVCGAPLPVTLDGEARPLWQSFSIPAGGVLSLGKLDMGCRAYLLVAGGFPVAPYLGSRATFTLGQFGGHAGRALRTGDMLPLAATSVAAGSALPTPPRYGRHWTVAVMYGPHGAPDFFTGADIAAFFAADWQVHYNSSRTGVRLIGPKPDWARADGGEAGLHPSNIHDNAYAIGAIDFTGDMPVILGPDGPSLGGFVCPAVIALSDLWKFGQFAPGDTLRFVPISHATARRRAQELEDYITGSRATPPDDAVAEALESPVIAEVTDSALPLLVRQAGDDYLLLEYGELVLDIALRMRVQALWQALTDAPIAGVLDLTPGVRSLQVHFDAQALSREVLLTELLARDRSLPALADMEVPSRIVHLPLSWDDSQTRLAIEKYMQSVRPDAPWCPSNIEFIRRINGLADEAAVKRIVFDASYLVLGLGDVYLGAPVATPLDPRHRLVTTKYNPARTWTPENAVGIGGAYMCVYGMEGPGGYQFVGRTVQMWNRYRQTENFTAGAPWLLRFFDQIRFYPVSEEDLLAQRRDFLHGRFTVKVEETRFRLADYQAFLADNAASIEDFRQLQRGAFHAERERWEALGLASWVGETEAAGEPATELTVPEGCRTLDAHLAGNVWHIGVAVGDSVAAGQALLVLEAMKMEIAVQAAAALTVVQVLVEVGQAVQPGQALLVVKDVLPA